MLSPMPLVDSMVYKRIVRPVLFKMHPEKVHDRTVTLGRIAGSNALSRGALRALYYYAHPALVQTVRGITFKNPVGLAAGFDKNCQLMKVLPTVGFGFEEVGSITAEAYAGNSGTRLKRLPKDHSLIVFYGLKNRGAIALRERFVDKKGVPKKFAIPIGISVAKTNKEFHSIEEKIGDWVRGVQWMKDCGDYITINVSCPNTYDKQNFGEPCLLAQLLDGIENAKLGLTKPVFIKLSADVSLKQLEEIITVCDKHSFVKGFILTNLVKDRSKLHLITKEEEYADQRGGISGRPVMPYALMLTKHAYRLVGDRYTIIGCGGIFTADDAYKYVRGGATLVQLVTGMIYGGPGTIKNINKGLVKLLERDGFTNISQAIGADVQTNWKR